MSGTKSSTRDGRFNGMLRVSDQEVRSVAVILLIDSRCKKKHDRGIKLHGQTVEIFSHKLSKRYWRFSKAGQIVGRVGKPTLSYVPRVDGIHDCPWRMHRYGRFPTNPQ